MLRLQILAAHVHSIATEKPGNFELCPCPGLVVKVRIEKKTTPGFCEDPVWDEVYINGKWCGNRHGGINEFIELVNAHKPEIDWDDAVTERRQRNAKASAFSRRG